MEWLIRLADWFGSAICHQWYTHSYSIAGVQLPLCARCTGLYLGALLTMTFLAWRRPRAVRAPGPLYLFLFLISFVLWGADGVNSFLSEIPGAPHLYEPQNLLRLASGALMGLTVGSLIFLLFNPILKGTPALDPLFADPREFAGLVALLALLVLIVNSQLPVLLYPVVAAILIAILTLHVSLWTTLVASFTLRLPDRRALRLTVILGTLVALILLNSIATGRVLLGIVLGAPI